MSELIEGGFHRFLPGKKVREFALSSGDDERYYAGNFSSLTLEIVSMGAEDVSFIVGRYPWGRETWWPLSAVKLVEWEQ